MKWYTHLTCTTLLLATLSKFFPLTLGFILLSLVGSLLPDILESWLGLPHRSKYIHNYMAGVLLVALGFFSELLLALGVGYMHHLALDTMTVYGCHICDKRVKGMLKGNNNWHNFLAILAHLLLMLSAMIVH